MKTTKEIFGLEPKMVESINTIGCILKRPYSIMTIADINKVQKCYYSPVCSQSYSGNGIPAATTAK